MKRLHLFLISSGLAVAAGCGDNSKICGPGTADNNGDGLCEPSEVPPMCSNGTILDTATNSCVIDPNACQNGTVLINNKCVDPTEGLVVDLAEGPEPNNANVGGIEPSGAIAGVIMLKPQGQTFVVKGSINPFRDQDSNGEIDPDMDTYVLAVEEPTLVEITVDGTNGLMGAFLTIAVNDNPAGAWLRYGMNITGDTSKRQIFFPTAGEYAISVADTRTMFFDGDSPPAAGLGGASGSPQSNYFMSLTIVPTPAPTQLTVTGTTATNMGMLSVGEVKFFTVPMGLGLNSVVLDIPGTPNAAVVVDKNGAFKAEAAETVDFFGSVPAAVTAAGFRATDTSLIVVDTTYHYGPGATPYTLTVTKADAGQLSTTGGTVTQPESDTDFSAFFYDIAAVNEVTGFALTWNQPVSGVVVDEDLFLAANFTYDPNNGFTNRLFSGYTGLIRHRAPGRYYFLTFDPNATGPTEIAATSTLAAQTVGTVTTGTPATNQMVNTTFKSNGAIYDSDVTVVWQLFNATGTGTGNITNTFFKESTAYGRLDPLTTTGAGTIINDTAPIFAQTYAAAGAPQGRILLDDGTAKYFVTTRTATTAGTPTYNLDFKTRGYFDYNMVNAGMTVVRNGEMIDATNPVRYYLLRATNGNKVSITTDPVTATLDTRIQTHRNDETVRRSFNNAIAGLDDIGQILQGPEGWTAFTISSPIALTATATYNLTLNANTFTPPTYTRAAGATVFANACTGGTMQALVDDGSGFGPANDEGFTASQVNSPNGFSFYGFIEPSFTVSTNGWLTFAGVTTALFTNPDMPLPGVPNGVIAPFWDDLENVVICTKTIGTKLVVQWTGNRFNAATQIVQFQAILDGADNTIEFVWGPGHIPTGGTATIGIEDQVGMSASKIGFNAANTSPPNTAVKFTPM